MENLLQKNELRQLRLAEFLIEKDGWVTFQELAEELGCSERVLKYDVNHFKETFFYFKIESSHYGIRLVFEQNKGFKNIYQSVFDSSYAFQLLELLFFEENYSINQLADRLYISSSSLYRLINQVNDVIIEYGFQIETNPCRLNGAENSIRYFYYKYFFEKYTILTWPYNEIDQPIVNDLLDFFINMTNFKADFAYYNIAKLILFINFSRYQKKHYISVENGDLNKMIASLSIPENKREFFEEKYRFKIDEAFITQIFSPFVQTGYFFSYEQLVAESKQNEQIANRIEQIEQLLRQISQDNKINLTSNERIILELYNAELLEKFDPRSGYILYDRNTLFLNRLRKKYPEFYQSIKLHVKEYRENTGLNLIDRNVNYMLYTLVVEWENLIPQLEKNMEQIKVLILSNRTISHSHLLKYILETEFYHFLVADIYTGAILSINALEKLHYDFIVSNFPIPDLTSKKSFYIENFPSKNQLKQIQYQINKLQNKNHKSN